MRIALVQVASPREEPQSDRVARVAETVRGLDDVDLVVLPELWAPGYFAFDRYAELAESLDGPLVRELSSWAADRRIHLHGGSIVERDESGALHNTALLIGPDGRVLLAYRKVHVFGYQSLEAELLTPGTEAGVADTPLGTVGTTTCYDLRFPELYRHLGDNGAQLVVVPAAWPLVRLEHWRLFTRARAVENQVFVIACNAAGPQGDVILGGHSAVVDPWGETVVEASTDEEVVYADIDLDLVTTIRNDFPILRDRQLRVAVGFG